MTRNVFPLYISTRFTCPGEKNICGIKARIRDLGSCIIRVFAIESNPPRSKSDRPRHEVEVKGEYRIKECAECPFNPTAAEIIRELLHPSPAPKGESEKLHPPFFVVDDYVDGTSKSHVLGVDDDD